MATTLPILSPAVEIEELEELEAPGLGSWLAGIGAGIAVGAAAVGLGLAIT